MRWSILCHIINTTIYIQDIEILDEFSESRISYDAGEGEELGKVISKIGEKYGL